LIQILARDQVLLGVGDDAHDGLGLLRGEAGGLELIDGLEGIEGRGSHRCDIAVLSVPGKVSVPPVMPLQRPSGHG
jgi:hypothetical protein